MALSIKDGPVGIGSWVAVADGTLKFKRPGQTSWTYPTFLKIKDGPVGGGTWVDSGYESFPNPPRNLQINGWTYTTMSVKWDAPLAGGAPTDTYKIYLTNSSGSVTLNGDRTGVVTSGLISTKTDATSPTTNFTVSNDTNYKVYIASVSAAGLYSTIVGPLKPAIGHPEETALQWVRKSKSYSKATSATWYVGAGFQGHKPSPAYYTSHGFDLGVYVTTVEITYNISSWTSSLESATRNAQFHRGETGGYVYVDFVGTYYGGPWGGSASSQVYNNPNRWSGNRYWGFYLTGSGWGTSAGSAYALPATVRCKGTEYYEVQEEYVSVTEQPNGYW